MCYFSGDYFPFSVNPLVELKPNAGSDTSWTFSIDDFADNLPKLDTFAIRFKTSESMQLVFNQNSAYWLFMYLSASI